MVALYSGCPSNQLYKAIIRYGVMIVSYRVIRVKVQKVDVRVKKDICIELLPVSGREKSVELRSELCEMLSL